MGEKVEEAQARVSEALSLLALAQEQEALAAALDRAVASGMVTEQAKEELLVEEASRFAMQRERVAAVGEVSDAAGEVRVR